MDSLIRLETLPNELLIDIFKYMGARNLYQSFYNLNYRFNALLNSLTQLCLILWPLKSDNYDHLFASRVDTLIVHNDVTFTLSQYQNIRHLILSNSKYDQISKIMIEGIYLETISLISPRCFYTTFNIHEMIFSNKFPYLKSCYLTTVYSPSFELRQLSWSQSPSLRSLRISSRDSLIHIAILNACPNLYFLELSLYQLDYTPLDIKPHQNLRRLKFILNNLTWSSDKKIFETFFYSIPYLEHLTIQRSITLPEQIHNLVQFDSLSKILHKQLPYLKQFIYYLHLLNSYQMNLFELDKDIYQAEKIFVNIFQKYQYYYLHIMKF